MLLIVHVYVHVYVCELLIAKRKKNSQFAINRYLQLNPTYGIMQFYFSCPSILCDQQLLTVHVHLWPIFFTKYAPLDLAHTELSIYTRNSIFMKI